ncbi:MAG: cytochrome c oxidase subunit 3 [Novosphingobium sp.]|nr:cytochrome c oxidase subunit 3 [Novosphingobium sp.]
MSEALTEVPEKSHIPGEPGVWLLLFGEMTVFASLFATFLMYRSGDAAGYNAAQEALSPAIGLTNTLVLLTSSLFVARAVAATREHRTDKAPRLFLAALACALGFIALKTFEYHELFGHGIAVDTHPFYSFYFGLTVLHLGHVVIGAVLLFLLSRAARTELTKPLHLALTESAGCFWHMVDLLWIILFPLLYLVR